MNQKTAWLVIQKYCTMEILTSNCPICEESFPDSEDWHGAEQHMMSHTDAERLKANLTLKGHQRQKK